jgi:hypothetical protein
VRRLVSTAVLAAVFAAPSVAVAPTVASADGNAARALRAYAAMQRYFVDPRSGAYREAVGSSVRAHAWPASQAIAAAIAVAQLPGASPTLTRAARQRIDRLEDLRSGPVYAAWAGGDVYYDDNEWISEDLLDMDAAWGGTDGRREAIAIFGAVVRAWDADASHPCPGGVAWTTAAANDDRNTVTTANGAVLGLRLYALTPKPVFLYWSRRMLDWLDACMLAPNGLYWDHIDANGAVDPTQWSYNQGSLIRANVLLYRSTHDPTALARAESLADATLSHFAGAALAAEPPEFAAIFFRNLLALAAIDHRGQYVAAAQAYADRSWARRDRRTDLVSSGRPTRLLDQSAIALVYAALARAKAVP